jgi:integrase
LKAFFNWCIARNLAGSNPVCRVKFFNDDNSRLRYLTEDEYKRLIDAARTIDASPLLAEKIILSVHTGLRRGSLFHLRWDHVDFLVLHWFEYRPWGLRNRARSRADRIG